MLPPLTFSMIDFLTSLPCEVVLQVMSWMDLTTLLGMASVSKRWYELSKTNDIWRRRLIEMHWLPIRPCSSFTRSIASSTTDWYYWYKQRYQLEKRWRSGNVTTHYLLGHQDSVYCLQFDASQIVTGGRDRTIRFWDMSTYTCTRTLIGHEGSVLALQYNDQLMVSSSSDTTVIVWCIKTFKPIQRLRVNTTCIPSIESISDIENRDMLVVFWMFLLMIVILYRVPRTRLSRYGKPIQVN